MFLGEYPHTLDAKGRIVLPARFRDRVADGLVFAPGQERCVVVYPVEAFERRAAELRAWPQEDQRTRAFVRVFFGRAHRDQPDAQGRVTLPPTLREYAGLGKDLTVIGADEKFEIWDRATWEAYRASAEDDFAGVGASFASASPDTRAGGATDPRAAGATPAGAA